MRAAGIRVLGAAGHRSDLAGIGSCSTDPDPLVRVAVASALSRVGDDAVRARVAADIVHLARSGVAHERTVAALMLGEVEPGPWVDRGTLGALLADAEADVVNAALAGLTWPEDAALIPRVTGLLDDRQTAGAAVDALVRAGDDALTVVDDGLRGDEHGRHAQELLVRAGREIGGPSAVAVLRHHVEHRDREVGLAVMRALAALGPDHVSARVAPARSNDEEPDLTARVVREDLDHATHALRALVAFENEPAATLQCAALRDELDLIRKRVLAAFSMRHGTEGFDRVVFQLAQRDQHSHALALEWLDVTLTGTDRAAVALLEPRLSDRERLGALVRTFPVPTLAQTEILLELVQDRDGRWRRPWVKACALYTASSISGAEVDLITAAAAESLTEFGTDEERIVHETLTEIRSRRLDLV